MSACVRVRLSAAFTSVSIIASASTSCSQMPKGSRPFWKRRAIRGWSFSSCSIRGISAIARLRSAIGRARLRACRAQRVCSGGPVVGGGTSSVPKQSCAGVGRGDGGERLTGRHPAQSAAAARANSASARTARAGGRMPWLARRAGGGRPLGAAERWRRRLRGQGQAGGAYLSPGWDSRSSSYSSISSGSSKS